MNMTKTGVLLFSAAMLLPAAGFSQNLIKKGAGSLVKNSEQAAAKAAEAAAQSARELLHPAGQWTVNEVPGLTENLSQAAREAVQKQQASLNAGVFNNPMEKQEVLTKLRLMDQMVSSIRNNPAVIFKEKFALQRESLQKLGIPVSAQPALPYAGNVRQRDVNKFVKDFEESFNTAYAALSARLGQTPKTIKLQDLFTKSQKELMLARGRDTHKWDVFMKASNKANLSWGFPGVDQIKLAPASSVYKSSHFLNNSSKLINAIAEKSSFRDFNELMDLVLSERLIPSYAQQDYLDLVRFISGSCELLSTDFFTTYVRINKAFPVVTNASLDGFSNYTRMELYARNTLAKAVVKKQKGLPLATNEAGSTKLTLCLSLLPYPAQRYVTIAMTRQEYDAALWMLKNPKADKKNTEIARWIDQEYSGMRSPVFFSRVEKLPKPEIPTFADYHQALKLRAQLLNDRITKASSLISEMENSVAGLSNLIQESKAPVGVVLNNNNASQEVYARRVRAELDNKVTQLKRIAKNLREEYHEVQKELHQANELEKLSN